MPITILLRVSEGQAPPPALTFDGPRIVIGRGASSDVRIPDASVSQRHACIQVNAGEHTLTDESSTNGTFVGNVRLAPGAPRVLRSGDLVRIGRVWIEIRIDQTPATRDLSIATKDLALQLVSQAMVALGEDVATKLRVVEGPDRGAVLSLEEEDRPYVLGRGPSCDLPLEEPEASREHVQVTRHARSVLLRDLDSKNGVYLGQGRIAPGRDTIWKATTMVRIGNTVLALEEPVADALTEIERSVDEPVAPEDVPPAPKTLASPAAGPPPSSLDPPASSAPIASIEKPAVSRPPPSSKRAPTFAAADLLVVAAAIAIIAASIGGLVWLLKS